MSEVIKECDGVVKFIKRHPGKNSMDYGFIKCNDPEIHDDVFINYKEVEPWRTGFKDLSEGDEVHFEIRKNRNGKGLFATNLKILKSGGSYANKT